MQTQSRVALKQNYQQADRLMLFVIWGLFVISLGLSTLNETLRWSLLVGLPIALLPTALIFALPGRFLTRAVVASSLMALTALHIHQAAGVAEAHFGVFVLLAFLLCYRDWKVILIAAGVIAVHHLLFNYLQEWGYGVLCFTEPGLGKVVAHAAYVVGESAVLCYLSLLLQRDAVRAVELNLRVKNLAENEQGIIDLTQRAHAGSSDAGNILEGLIARLRAAIATVQDGAQTISETTNRITADNIELAARTRKQSQSLLHIATSMNQMTNAVRNNAESASQANALAVSASQVATRGGEVVSRVVQTMGSINDSARKITDIIAVIDGIAFQTNILALNASVEAARAGEQGRGFAVVASEVRNLAQRSASAAKDIKVLIEDSVKQAGSGLQLVNEAGMTMQEIVNEVGRVTKIMAGILEASRGQTQEIEQVDAALKAIDRIAQQNAGLVSQGEASAMELQQQVENLLEVVQVFQLESTRRQPQRQVVKPAATRPIAPPPVATRLRRPPAVGLLGA